MQIIPAINCADFECVKEKLEKVAEFYADGVHHPHNFMWGVQFDIADGKFTNYKTWNRPEDLINLKTKSYKLKANLEIHLMVEEPEKVIDDWIKAGAKRIIFHLETIKDLEFKTKEVEIGLAINPDTPVGKLMPYLSEIKFVQILAVNPGLAGQKFQLKVLDKIKFLKENYPDVKIEVDGGINLETAKLCKDAGVDVVVSASYIWNSDNPKEAFKKLKNL